MTLPSKWLFPLDKRRVELAFKDNNPEELLKVLGTLVVSLDRMYGEIYRSFSPLLGQNRSAFYAYPSANQENIAIDSIITVQFNSELYDTLGDYDTGTYTFTAPVDGKYLLYHRSRVLSLDVDASYYYVGIKTTNQHYNRILDSDEFGSDLDYWGMDCFAIESMSKGHTAYATIYQSGGAAQADIASGTGNSSFLGMLLA